ncbi:AraC family transcriptional regulator [Gimesia fumaroli]|uniref:Arabinose operon regulatory protein n=1 Tax=Gimesia fumaroli TaxID=2527976 RepID=A0A518ILJ9_9PLAN|nr:AraC family transcriptional regulator [Gimesia fumaroli]QDV53969.1 Arabinose operon regulatory protein [Gimesia fumaroli]
MRHQASINGPESSQPLIHQREITPDAEKTDLSYYLPSTRPQRLGSLKQSWSYLAYYHPTPGPFARFTSGHFPPGTTTQKHNHAVIAMHGSLQGPLTMLTPDGRQVLDSGDFCMIGPGVDHHWMNEGPHTASTIAFLIDPERLGEWPEDSGMVEACRELETLVTGVHTISSAGNPDLQHAFWRMADMLIAEHPHRNLDVTSSLLAFLSQVLENLSPAVTANTEDDIALQIRRLLLNRVNDRLTIPQVAQELHVSPTQAKTAFRKTYGCGIMAYFNEIKIWQSKRMLCNPSMTIDQISRKLGFSSPAYFTRTFRKLTGETPTDFRSKRNDVK